MKILTRSIAVLLVLSASLLAQAPNMSGQWQGVLQAGKDLRVVVIVTGSKWTLQLCTHLGWKKLR